MLAEDLARKKFNERRIRECEAQLLELRGMQSRIHKQPVRTAEALLHMDGYYELLAPSLQSRQKRIYDWVNEEYRKSPYPFDEYSFKTETGELVRSKSEYIIYDKLLRHRIPFRYECALDLQGRIIYPDFSILHPIRLSLYLWEHLGLLGNPDYSQKAAQKIYDYSMSGWIVSQNLILTGEQEGKPLNPAIVTNNVQFYFLSDYPENDWQLL